MNKIFDLANKVILVTGGYGYLGKEIVLGLLSHKAKVIVLGRDLDKFEREFASVSFEKNLFFQYCDVSSSDSIKIAFNDIYQTHGIDVLINNAFYSRGQSPETMSDQDWEFGVDGTLNSCFRCIREVIPYFKEKKGAKIINVSSMYGMVAPQFEVYDEFPQYLNPPHYGASKAGIIQLTRYYASFLGKYGINVNSITPGPFPSDNVQASTSFIRELSSRTCLNRIGEPKDLVGAFIFLSSDASNFITGHNLVIDGGWTIR